MAVVAACAIAVAVGLWLVWSSARAAITVAFARIRDGELDVTKGGLAPRVLADLRDVVARPPIRRATLRIVRSGGRAKLEVRGEVDQNQLQRLRNVVGSVALARLANGRRR